jgi:hypothetical protein
MSAAWKTWQIKEDILQVSKEEDFLSRNKPLRLPLHLKIEEMR